MLIDANVFNGYFQYQIGRPHTLQGCPNVLMQSLTTTHPVHHDDGGIIEHEWRSVVDPDWFDVWLASNLQSGLIQYQVAKKDGSVESKLKAKGFPIGRDIIYVRVGLSVVSTDGVCAFFTEDMDFYDPTMKGCSATSRKKILQKSSGPVSKILSKSGVNVTCVP